MSNQKLSIINCQLSIIKYFPNLSDRQIEQFSMLGGLYADWNSRINVISRKDIDQLYERHVLHSLAIAKIVSFAGAATILDVGTGGGFPGIPLAILFPETKFHLIDSIGKKIKVVDSIVKELQLYNVSTQNTPAQKITGKYDFVVSRAVASLSNFMPWMNGKLLKHNNHNIPNGMFFLKGGDLAEELSPYRDYATIFHISDFFTEPFFAEKKVVYIQLLPHARF